MNPVEERRFKVYVVPVQKFMGMLMAGHTLQLVNTELIGVHVHRIEFSIWQDAWLVVLAHSSFDPVPEGKECPYGESLLAHIQNEGGFFYEK